MSASTSGEILKQLGFGQIGELAYRLQLSLWWHPDAKIQVILVRTGTCVLVKGDKSYYLKSISEEGETWARDIGLLHDYLENHFPEVHVGFSFFRDVPEELARAHLERKRAAETPTITVPTVEHLARLQHEIAAKQRERQSAEGLLGLDSGSSALLQAHVVGQVRTFGAEIDDLEERLAQGKERLGLFAHLQKEYERKGSAASFVFSISSNVQVAATPDAFRDAVVSIVKELTDLHRYQVSQKLGGGRLNIHVAEVEEPVLVWVEQWLGGALSPKRLARLDEGFRTLKQVATEHLMVTPDEDICWEGAVREDKKLLAAQCFSTLVRRLDRPTTGEMNLAELPKEALPAWIGLLMQGEHATSARGHIPLSQVGHAYASGKTGSGKSFLARVLVEEAATHGLNILILDPRNQAAGLLVPEDRESILGLYPQFGMPRESARGFEFAYYAPADPCSEKLPTDLGKLAVGRTIVSFKGMDDRERCALFGEILDAVFDACAVEESVGLRLLLFIEEAQRFTKKRVNEDAKAAGERAEIALDRTVREGRKYGCCTFIISQTIRDFAYDSASIRQNTNTKFFLHNSDREVDYAADFLGDGREIIRLKPGTAIVFNPAWAAVKVKVRPPLSKVWEFSAEDTRQLVSGGSRRATALSAEAEQLFQVVSQHFTGTGAGLNLSRAAERLGITSKRRLLELIDELERAGIVRTRTLRERGQPRVIEPVPSTALDKTADETWTESGRKA